MNRKRAGGVFALLGALLFLGGLGHAGMHALSGAWDMSYLAIHAEMRGLAVAAIGLLMVGLGRWCYSYWRKWMSVLLGMMIAGYLVAVVACNLSWLRETRRWNAYEEIVIAVHEGALKPDKQGNILLPPSWAWATYNGHVYVMQGKGLTLLFPTDVDRWEKQIAGYVYSAEGLQKEQGFAFIKPDCDPLNDWDDEALPPHWYFAEPFYS